MSTGGKPPPQTILPIGSPEGPLMMQHLTRLRDVLKSRSVRFACFVFCIFFLNSHI
jgi:hypothetical protein